MGELIPWGTANHVCTLLTVTLRYANSFTCSNSFYSNSLAVMGRCLLFLDIIVVGATAVKQILAGGATIYIVDIFDKLISKCINCTRITEILQTPQQLHYSIGVSP